MPLTSSTTASHRILGFPNPVDETSARFVAAGVLVEATAFLVFRQWWLLLPLVYGFAARVLTGPKLSPLGLFVTKLVTPRVPGRHRFVPGPPKRFAQGIGLAFSAGALVAWSLGGTVVAIVLVAGLVVAATLESVFAICLGCYGFAFLMRLGVIPERVCLECADLRRRLAPASQG